MVAPLAFNSGVYDVQSIFPLRSLSDMISFLSLTTALLTGLACILRLGMATAATSSVRGNHEKSPEVGALKVFILAGQSNMVGMASLEHLRLLINGTSDGGNCPCEYQTLWNGTGFVERDDVFMRYNARKGRLTAGTGFAADNRFGPELGFGWEMGDALDETFVIVKAAYGGRSLAVDFRPPSSGEAPYLNVKPSHYGWEYRQMVLDVNDALDNLKYIYPGYDEARGFEIAGLVWFQGWNDLLSWPTVREYAFNLANFIRDIRKEVEAPEMPVIIGELGQGGMHPTGHGSDRHLAMRQAELSVTLLPEFLNSTLYVRTAPYMVENGTTYNGGYHYNGRADTYYHLGKAFGRGMLQLMNNGSAVVDAKTQDQERGYPLLLQGIFQRKSSRFAIS